MDDVLSAALSADNTVRRTAEATLTYASTQRGWPVALAKRLSQNYTSTYHHDSYDGGARAAERDDPTGGQRLMAGMLLQHYVRDRWEVACPTTLPRGDKEQVGQPVEQASLLQVHSSTLYLYSQTTFEV